MKLASFLVAALACIAALSSARAATAASHRLGTFEGRRDSSYLPGGGQGRVAATTGVPSRVTFARKGARLYISSAASGPPDSYVVTGDKVSAAGRTITYRDDGQLRGISERGVIRVGARGRITWRETVQVKGAPGLESRFRGTAARGH